MLPMYTFEAPHMPSNHLATLKVTSILIYTIKVQKSKEIIINYICIPKQHSLLLPVCFLLWFAFSLNFFLFVKFIHINGYCCCLFPPLYRALHHKNILQFTYWFSYWLAFGLFPVYGYYKECYCKLAIYISWVMQQRFL